ncbi:MAG: hypothetical protein IJL25_05040 [Clostridia bacterium]|nr:hypothetical protein [Clostridia bacterium]
MYSNYFNNQMFNPQYVNPQYYQAIRNQPQQTDPVEQAKEIANAVKAIHDLCEAVKKIDAQYQQSAFNACLVQLAIEMNW